MRLLTSSYLSVLVVHVPGLEDEAHEGGEGGEGGQLQVDHVPGYHPPRAHRQVGRQPASLNI